MKTAPAFGKIMLQKIWRLCDTWLSICCVKNNHATSAYDRNDSYVVWMKATCSRCSLEQLKMRSPWRGWQSGVPQEVRGVRIAAKRQQGGPAASHRRGEFLRLTRGARRTSQGHRHGGMAATCTYSSL